MVDTKDKRYVVNFEYHDVHYQLKGVMKKEEVIKIVKDLKFS